MRKYYLSSVLMLSLLTSNVTFAQSMQELQEIKGATQVKTLKSLEKDMLKSSKAAKLEALKMAKQKGWQVRGVDKDGSQFELMRVTKQGTPVYYTTYNTNAARSTRANTLNTGGSLGLSLNGENMKAYVWDGGHSLLNHTEYSDGFNSRVKQYDNSKLTPGNHAGHVMGTILAKGKDPKAKGMAPKAKGFCSDWHNDDAEVAAAAADGMLLSNHSYGYKSGVIPDAWFGAYGQDAVTFDKIMYNAPHYLMVVAAGNDGRDNYSNAQPLDGNSQYDKLSGHSTAKNNLVVANFRDANIDGDDNLINVERTASSSEGPTDDYRIKPDICGNGYQVWSPNAQGRRSYQFMTGTSMASPNVMGTLLLLQQHFNNVNGNYMKAATLKGLALHTADDVATDGPDATSGWGLLNAKFAAQTITGNGKSASIKELKLDEGAVYTANVKAIAGQTLKVSISWTDLPGKSTGNSLNNNTKKLVNDLDLEVTKGNKKYSPWLLTGITTNAKGDNDADPFERVDVADADGTYKIKVSHEGKLSSASQNFSIVVTGGIITNGGGDVDPNPDPVNPPTSCDKNEVSIDLNTGNYGYEISWAILDSKNKVVAKGDKYNSKEVVKLKECLADGCYKLRLSDQYGDGFSGAGSIKLMVKEEVKVDVKGNFGKTKDIDFCIEDKGDVTPPSEDCKGVKAGISFNSGTYGFEISWSILDGSGKKVLEGANYPSNKSVNLNKCLSKGCYTFKINDKYGDGFAGSGFAKITANGETKVDVSGNFGRTKSVEFCLGSDGGIVDDPTTPPVGCDNGQMAVINLNTGKFGEEIDWKIQNPSGKVILKGGNYPSNKIVEAKKCLPAGCYKFTVNDKYGDGFGASGMIKLSVGGNVKVNLKGNFGKSKSVYFCIDKFGGYSDDKQADEATLDMLIYPNPAKTEYVKLKSSDIKSGVYEIFSFDGTLVAQGKFENGDTQVNIKGLVSGTYLVKVSSKKGLSVTKQLIIRK